MDMTPSGGAPGTDPVRMLRPAWRRVRTSVALAVGLLVLGALLQWGPMVAGLAESLEIRREWLRVPAQVYSVSSRDWVEVEIDAGDLPRLGSAQRAHETGTVPDGKVRILVPREPLDGLQPFEPVEVARHPQQADRLTVLSLGADLWPALARLGQGALAVALAVFLWRRRWGQDLCWHGGSWRPVDDPGAAPATRAPVQQVLQEPPGQGRAMLIGVALFLAVLLVPLIVFQFAGTVDPMGAVVLVGVGGLLSALALAAVLRSRSRLVAWDDLGLVDASWFGARRVAFADVARCVQVNAAESAQRQFDNARPDQREGLRPADVPVWSLQARDGSELLSLPLGLTPHHAARVLMARLERPGLTP